MFPTLKHRHFQSRLAQERNVECMDWKDSPEGIRLSVKPCANHPANTKHRENRWLVKTHSECQPCNFCSLDVNQSRGFYERQEL